jgi:phenylacetic acid degradation operon negative regulatory protein
VHARSALFDVFGDHLRGRDSQAPVAALVRLLAPLGISPPAVRTAVSRMVRQGWLEPVTLPDGRGYRATPRCDQRLQEALARVYRVQAPTWDGHWHLLVVRRVPDRGTRERVRAALGYLGYACIADDTWMAPHSSTEVAALLSSEGVHAERFISTYDADQTALIRRAWDLTALGHAYERWLADATTMVGRLPDAGTCDQDAYATRCQLVHEWRKFLFTDPGLPAALLPPGWPGERAAAFFAAHAERLRPAATRFVDACLGV